jgi:hypothetical protein
MRASMVVLQGALVASIVACGDTKSDAGPGSGGTTSGAAGQGAAGRGGAGGGAGTGIGGAAGMGANGAGTSSTAGAGPTCATGTIDCNGVCVGPDMPGGGCTVLSLGGGTASIDHGFTLDEAFVYWVEQGTRLALSRVAKSGGAREDLLLPEDVPFSPSVNSTSVFFSIGGFDENTLNSIPKAGGTTTLLATHDDSFKYVVATESRVYFSRENFSSSSFDIASTTLDGMDEILHATTGSFGDNHTAVDGSHVYFIDDNFFDTPKLARTTLEGSEVETVVSMDGIAAFVLAGDAVVFYESSTKKFHAVPKAGGAPTALLTPSETPDSSPSLASAGGYLYWATPRGVWRAGVDGSNPLRLLTTSGVVNFVAADSSGVYTALDTRANAGPAYVVKLDSP